MTNPNMHSEGIDDEGEVEGHMIATSYKPCIGIMTADGYIRVIQDGEGQNYETRVDHALLIQAGWMSPQAAITHSENSGLLVGALDSLAIALSEHGHNWTAGERAIYEEAIRALGVTNPLTTEE